VPCELGAIPVGLLAVGALGVRRRHLEILADLTSELIVDFGGGGGRLTFS